MLVVPLNRDKMRVLSRRKRERERGSEGGREEERKREGGERRGKCGASTREEKDEQREKENPWLFRKYYLVSADNDTSVSFLRPSSIINLTHQSRYPDPMAATTNRDVSLSR